MIRFNAILFNFLKEYKIEVLKLFVEKRISYKSQHDCALFYSIPPRTEADAKKGGNFFD